MCGSATIYDGSRVFETAFKRRASAWAVVEIEINTMNVHDNIICGASCNTGNRCWLSGSISSGPLQWDMRDMAVLSFNSPRRPGWYRFQSKRGIPNHDRTLYRMATFLRRRYQDFNNRTEVDRRRLVENIISLSLWWKKLPIAILIIFYYSFCWVLYFILIINVTVYREFTY